MKLAAEKEGEDEAGRDGGGGLDIAEELKRRESRLAEIGRAKAEIERRAAERDAVERAEYEEKMARRAERQRETGRKPGGRPPKEPEPGPRAKDQVNLTDEESRIMPTSSGFEQCYNAQASVDEGSHLVVGAHVSQNPNDKLEVEPALAELAKAEAAAGRAEGLLADSGYFSRENVESCEAAGLEPSMAEGRERHNRPLELNPSEPAPCPADADAVERMRHRMKHERGQGGLRQAQGDGRDGVRSDQGGAWLPAVLDAGPCFGGLRVASGVRGMESEADARPESVRGMKLRARRSRMEGETGRFRPYWSRNCGVGGGN